jgi:hypothetical protein
MCGMGTMKILMLLAAIATLSGCAAHAPGDGRLVAVRLSPAVADYQVAPDNDATGGKLPAVSLSSFAADGVHYWDAVGAQLRVGADETQAAFVLEVVPDDGGVGAPTDAEGWFDNVDGKIHVVLPLRFSGPPATYRSFFAHEAGHALGLDHVSGEAGRGLNVMHPVDTCDRLGELDRAAFERLHH